MKKNFYFLPYFKRKILYFNAFFFFYLKNEIQSSSDSFEIHNQNNTPPLFVVGTKLNSAQMVRNSASLRYSSSSILNYRADEINIDCMDSKYLAPASSNSIKLAQFFDKTIQYKIAKDKRTTFRNVRPLSSEKDNKYSSFHAD